MSLVSERQRIAVLKARAISDEVADYTDPSGRPRYVSFEGANAYADIIREHHSHPKGWYSQLATLSSGLIVNRWNIAGDDLPSYMRFDEKLWTRSKPGHPSGPRQGFEHVHPRPDGKPERHRHGQGYIYPSKKDVGELVKVIDVHPLTVPLLMDDPTPPIYFCLEGCFKADSILSDRDGKAAISVPSVNHWHTAEKILRPLLPVLKAAPIVYVIPDSDYLRNGTLKDGQPVWVNPKVRIQSDKAARWLRNRGVKVRIMVPPLLPPEIARNLGVSDDDRLKQGIDDHLAHGGNFDRWDQATNPLGVHIVRWTPWQVRPQMPTRGSGVHGTRHHLERVAQMIEWLGATHAGGSGVFEVRDARAHFPDWGINAVNRVMQTARELGFLLFWPGRPVYDEERDDYYNAPHSFIFQLKGRPKDYCLECGTILDGHVPGSTRCIRRVRELAAL